MSKLPQNMVKKPSALFDSPLRRTSTPEVEMPTATQPEALSPSLQLVPDTVEAGDVIATIEGGATTSIVAAPTRASSGDSPAREGQGVLAAAAVVAVESDLRHRLTLRLPDDIWKALHDVAHRRRMSGENVTAAEVAREALAAWAQRAR